MQSRLPIRLTYYINKEKMKPKINDRLQLNPRFTSYHFIPTDSLVLKGGDPVRDIPKFVKFPPLRPIRAS